LLPEVAPPFYPAGVTSAGDMQLGKRDVLLELNTRVHEAARRFEGAEPERDLWDFTCECGAAGCRAPVSLTLAEYEAFRLAQRPVLAAGHEQIVSGDTLSTA
jgi:hypothetical protein